MTVTKVRTLVAAVAALLIAAPAMAEDAKAGEESVKQLLEVMKVSRIVDNYVAQVEPPLIEAYRNTFTQREIEGLLDYYARLPARRSLPSSRACSSKACSSCSSG